jgi:hypothetical protein
LGECGLHDGGVCEALRLSAAALLRSVGVGGDEVFEIQDRAGLAAANRGRRLNCKAVMGCFESVKWLRLPTAVRDVPGACAACLCLPVHDLALSPRYFTIFDSLRPAQLYIRNIWCDVLASCIA